MRLQWAHNRPLTNPLEWQWSITKDFLFVNPSSYTSPFTLQILHLPFCFLYIETTSAEFIPYRRLSLLSLPAQLSEQNFLRLLLPNFFLQTGHFSLYFNFSILYLRVKRFVILFVYQIGNLSNQMFQFYFLGFISIFLLDS